MVFANSSERSEVFIGNDHKYKLATASELDLEAVTSLFHPRHASSFVKVRCDRH